MAWQIGSVSDMSEALEEFLWGTSIASIYSMAIFRFMLIQYATFIWQCYLEPICIIYKT